MTMFTESHLRRMIEGAKGREVSFHLLGGSTASGIVTAIDKDQDGFIEIDMDVPDGRVRFVTPVDNIVAYEVAIAE